MIIQSSFSDLTGRCDYGITNPAIKHPLSHVDLCSMVVGEGGVAVKVGPMTDSALLSRGVGCGRLPGHGLNGFEKLLQHVPAPDCTGVAATWSAACGTHRVPFQPLRCYPCAQLAHLCGCALEHTKRADDRDWHALPGAADLEVHKGALRLRTPVAAQNVTARGWCCVDVGQCVDGVKRGSTSAWCMHVYARAQCACGGTR